MVTPRGQAGPSIAIDMGEITTGITAIAGFGRGFAGQEHLNKFVRSMVLTANKGFGRVADAAGAAEAAHVYEYGMRGNPAGRLWKMHWAHRKDGATGNIFFMQSKRPTQVGDGIDPRIADSAAKVGRTIAQHIFPDKAKILEIQARTC